MATRRKTDPKAKRNESVTPAAVSPKGKDDGCMTAADVIAFLRNQPQDAEVLVERYYGQQDVRWESVCRIVVETYSDEGTVVVFE